MRINGVTYEKLKTPLKVNGNLKHLRLKFQNEMKVPDANWVREIYVFGSDSHYKYLTHEEIERYLTAFSTSNFCCNF